ncbi:MAG TPA: hypothetical protein DIC42_02555 [Holosporales bacterium]|nr:hypothetical protein [Holosporales bacterium]
MSRIHGLNTNMFYKNLREQGAELLKPLNIEQLENSFNIYNLNGDFASFYQNTNGLIYESFRVLPFYDANNTKKTWDSFEKANADKSKFSLERSVKNNFLVFAEIGSRHCGLYQKNNGSLWFEDDNGFHQTDMNLGEFIIACIKEQNRKEYA